MKQPWLAVVLLVCTSVLLAACKAPEEARPAAQEAPTSASATAEKPSPLPSPETAPVGPTPAAARSESEPAPGTKPTQAARTAPASQTPTPAAAATAATVPTPAPPTAAPTAPPLPTAAPTVASAPTRSTDVVDPGGAIAVPPSKAGLTSVGTEKCKVCHKVQHTSWATSAHAKRTPPLDCESCHGPGSEYKALAVMKDPAKAKAAGLVAPDATFCARCHKGKVDPAFLRKVHAHKAAS